MANTAQLLRRQSSRDIPLRTQRSIDVLELRVCSLSIKNLNKKIKVNVSGT